MDLIRNSNPNLKHPSLFRIYNTVNFSNANMSLSTTIRFTAAMGIDNCLTSSTDFSRTIRNTVIFITLENCG